MNKLKKGFTLLEILLFTGVISIGSIGTYVIYRQVSSWSASNEEAKQLNSAINRLERAVNASKMYTGITRDSLDNLGGYNSSSGFDLTNIVSPTPDKLHFNYSNINNLECSKFLSKMISMPGNVSAIVNGKETAGGTDISIITENCKNDSNAVTIVLTSNVSVAGLGAVTPSGGPTPPPSPSSPSPSPSSPVPSSPSPSSPSPSTPTSPPSSPSPSPAPSGPSTPSTPSPSPSPSPGPSPAPSSPSPSPSTPPPAPAAPAPAGPATLAVANASRNFQFSVAIPPAYNGMPYQVVLTTYNPSSVQSTLSSWGGTVSGNGAASPYSYNYTGPLDGAVAGATPYRTVYVEVQVKIGSTWTTIAYNGTKLHA